jgi:hypothetical protein
VEGPFWAFICPINFWSTGLMSFHGISPILFKTVLTSSAVIVSV